MSPKRNHLQSIPVGAVLSSILRPYTDKSVLGVNVADPYTGGKRNVQDPLRDSPDAVSFLALQLPIRAHRYFLPLIIVLHLKCS